MFFTPKRSRLLTAWILTVALATVLAAQPTAYAGEPDSGQGTMPPSQQQQTGDATLPWAQRIQAALQALLMSMTSLP